MYVKHVVAHMTECMDVDVFAHKNVPEHIPLNIKQGKIIERLAPNCMIDMQYYTLNEFFNVWIAIST